MKKLLVLGGAKAQVQLIQAAKNEGYFVILCDYTDTNPGIVLCDKHYKINYMDTNAVLKIAKEEAVDGCISNSEYAMETVSMVCDLLNLNGNSSESLERINDKNKFRKLQKELGLYVPKSFITTSFEESKKYALEMNYPVVIKPDKSSGSRGTTVVEKLSDFSKYEQNWKECFDFSRNNKVIIEEFVKMPSLYVIEGDIFVYNELILFNGIFTTKRSMLRPLLPMTYSCPVILDENHLSRFKNDVERIVKKSGITFGELNVEAYFTENDNLFFIEINARQGGNGIPEMIKKHSGIDYSKLLVTCAVVDSNYLQFVMNNPMSTRIITRHAMFWAPVSGQKEGIYKGVYIDNEIEKFVTSIKEICTKDSLIRPCKNGTDYLAIIDLEFENENQQKEIFENIESYIYPIVK